MELVVLLLAKQQHKILVHQKHTDWGQEICLQVYFWKRVPYSVHLGEGSVKNDLESEMILSSSYITEIGREARDEHFNLLFLRDSYVTDVSVPSPDDVAHLRSISVTPLLFLLNAKTRARKGLTVLLLVGFIAI